MNGPVREASPRCHVRASDGPHIQRRDDSGSVLLLVLFVCLGVAVVLQALSAAVLCAERAAIDESVGRLRLEEKDQGLVALRQRVLLTWAPLPWTVVRGGEAPVEGSLAELEDGAGWVMSAATKQQPEVSRLTTSAWIERGRDGIDLPLAAVVAGSISVDPERELPWVELDPAVGGPGERTTDAAMGYVEDLPEAPILGDGCSLSELTSRWRLDPGWLRLRSQTDIEGIVAALAKEPTIIGGAGEGGEEAPVVDLASLPAVAPTSQVAVLTAKRGRRVDIPEEIGRGAPGAPILVVLSGGADLEARDLGDIYGVLVVDGGSLLLEGTTVHGAVFVTEGVSLGKLGRVLFSREVLRWATDRSLSRARLVPGTRWEDTK